MDRYILGIDMAKASFEIALLHPKGVCVTGSFANSPTGFGRLQRWLLSQDALMVHACLEATGRYGHGLAAFLFAQGHAVSLVNPLRIRAYGQSKLLRTKSDLIDAKLIADFCATQSPPRWQPPSTLQAELQALTRHLEALKQSRQKERNRLQAGIPSATVRRAIQEHLDFLDRQIDQLDQEVQHLTEQNDAQRQQMQLLVSIPGISALTAAKFLAEVPDVHAFPQAEQLAAYAGLCPRQHTSGTSVRKKARLAKTGNVFLRTALYMPALAAMRCNPIIQTLVRRLQARGKSPMTIVGAVMRKLLHLAYGVLKTGKPFDPNYMNTQIAT
jgi:transposase